MELFTVKTYQPSNKTIWDNFLQKSNQDTFLFNRHFMDYHSDRFTDFSLLIYKNDKLFALLPANKVDAVLYSHQGLTYGGLIYKIDAKSSDIIYSFKAIIEFLNTNNIETLALKELPTIYLHNATNNPLHYLLFKIKAKLMRTDMQSVVNMKHIEYSNSRKKGYKRGVKYDLKVKETDNSESFWKDILTPNLKQKHGIKPIHTLEEITLLKSRFPKNIRQFNVYHNNQIVCGTTVFEMKNIAHCQYISGNTDKNKLGSLDFLHTYLIEDVFSDKTYFSFGTSNINDGEQINEGLQYWKEGFGARSIPQGFYNIATENYKLLDGVLV